MFFSMCMMFIFGFLYQILIGNKGRWIIGGIVLFSIGFGWYAYKLKGEENENRI